MKEDKLLLMNIALLVDKNRLSTKIVGKKNQKNSFYSFLSLYQYRYASVMLILQKIFKRHFCSYFFVFAPNHAPELSAQELLLRHTCVHSKNSTPVISRKHKDQRTLILLLDIKETSSLRTHFPLLTTRLWCQGYYSTGFLLLLS